MAIVSSTITDIGPIAPGLTVEWDVFPEVGEVIALSCIKSVNQERTVTATLASRFSGSFRFPVALPIEGDPVRLVTKYTDELGTVVQQDTKTGLTWSNAGLWAEILEQPTASGGFTAQDRENLDTTLAAVQVPFPISTAVGAVAQTALATIVQSAPIGLLSKQECQNLTGDGILTRPGGLFNVNALGLTWQFLSVPEFFGKREGVALEYEERILQLKMIAHDFHGVDAVVQLVDAHSDQQFITWGMTALNRIEYSVTPGCEVQVCWLLLLG
jgi:hypothetical protein